MGRMARRAAIRLTVAGGGLIGFEATGDYLLRRLFGSSQPHMGASNRVPVGAGPQSAGMMGSATTADISTYMDLFNRHTELRRTVEVRRRAHDYGIRFTRTHRSVAGTRVEHVRPPRTRSRGDVHEPEPAYPLSQRLRLSPTLDADRKGRRRDGDLDEYRADSCNSCACARGHRFCTRRDAGNDARDDGRLSRRRGLVASTGLSEVRLLGPLDEERPAEGVRVERERCHGRQ